MDEQAIRKIVREEMARNYNSGTPQVPPHRHDGVSNLLIDPTTLGMYAVPQLQSKVTYNYQATSNGVTSTNIASPAYGFASPSILSPASTGHLQQYVSNPFVYINPIPIVAGNGVGIQGSFNGGAAPDGTMVAFITGSTTTSFLYIRFSGSWYGVNLAASPVTP